MAQGARARKVRHEVAGIRRQQLDTRQIRLRNNDFSMIAQKQEEREPRRSTSIGDVENTKEESWKKRVLKRLMQTKLKAAQIGRMSVSGAKMWFL